MWICFVGWSGRDWLIGINTIYKMDSHCLQLFDSKLKNITNWTSIGCVCVGSAVYTDRRCQVVAHCSELTASNFSLEYIGKYQIAVNEWFVKFPVRRIIIKQPRALDTPHFREYRRCFDDCFILQLAAATALRSISSVFISLGYKIWLHFVRPAQTLYREMLIIHRPTHYVKRSGFWHFCHCQLAS